MFVLLVVILRAAFVWSFCVSVRTEKVSYNSLNLYCFVLLKLSYSLTVGFQYYGLCVSIHVQPITVIHIEIFIYSL